MGKEINAIIGAQTIFIWTWMSLLPFFTKGLDHYIDPRGGDGGPYQYSFGN